MLTPETMTPNEEAEFALFRARALKLKEKIAKIVLNEIKGLPSHEQGNLIGETAFSFVDWSIKNISNKEYLNCYSLGLKDFVQQCTEKALLDLTKKKGGDHANT